MADSSSDEAFIIRLSRALEVAKLEAVVIGLAAAVLQGAPVTTQDVDLLVRRTRRNQEKIVLLRGLLGGLGRVEVTSQIDALVGGEVQVDLIYDAIPPNLAFETVRSRASRMDVGGAPLLVAALEDIIRSKRAAGRAKDLAVLPLLEDTLRVRRALEGK
jgi:predicted nucleotidyltransferase